MNKFNLHNTLQKLQQQKSDLPQALASATQQYFLKSFDNQAWNNQPWPPRKLRKNETNKPLLIKTGALKNAVSKSVISADATGVKFQVPNLVYAPVHNNGLHAGRGKGFQMPQRQFIGHTEELATIQKNIIKTYINKVWQK